LFDFDLFKISLFLANSICKYSKKSFTSFSIIFSWCLIWINNSSFAFVFFNLGLDLLFICLREVSERTYFLWYVVVIINVETIIHSKVMLNVTCHFVCSVAGWGQKLIMCSVLSLEWSWNTHLVFLLIWYCRDLIYFSWSCMSFQHIHLIVYFVASTVKLTLDSFPRIISLEISFLIFFFWIFLFYF